MNKYSFFIALLSLFGTGHVLAQTTSEKEGSEKKKQETVTTGLKPDPGIKVVPAARDNKAKPAKVSSARPTNVRPGRSRPARNIRPSSRPVRPGHGRN